MQPYSASEWQTLLFSLLWAFEAVAAADGTIDKAEDSTLQNFLRTKSDAGALFERARADLLADYERLHHKYHDDPRDIDAGLKDLVRALARHASPEEARQFREALAGLAQKTAEASGGFLGVGNKVSAKEKERILALRKMLGLS